MEMPGPVMTHEALWSRGARGHVTSESPRHQREATSPAATPPAADHRLTCLRFALASPLLRNSFSALQAPSWHSRPSQQ